MDTNKLEKLKKLLEIVKADKSPTIKMQKAKTKVKIKWGRPKGIPTTEETKAKLSKAVHEAYLKKKREAEELKI